MMMEINYKQLVKKSELLQPEELESLEYRHVEIKHLKRANYSNRVPIDNRLQVLSNSLFSNGFIGSILVSKSTFSVIDGWQRLQLWEALGNSHIPCHVIECSYSREQQLHLSFNQQVSEFDLHEFGLAFDDIDFSDFGFAEIEYIDNNVMATIEREQGQNYNTNVERIKKPTIPCTVAVV
jgi:hypothetical protein